MFINTVKVTQFILSTQCLKINFSVLCVCCFDISGICYEDFMTIPKSAYTIFRMMLNMVDLTAYNVSSPSVLYIIHVSFVMAVSILTINLLIGVMAEKVTQVANYR